MNVLVYNGPGVSARSFSETRLALRLLLSQTHSIIEVNAKQIIHDPWQPSTSLLIIPGGRDLPYIESLSSVGQQRIRDFVLDGGKYLGICAGAYFASKRVEFEVGKKLEVKGERGLGFWSGTCRGGVVDGFEYETENGAKDLTISMERTLWRDVWADVPRNMKSYWNGGGCFIDAEDENFKVLARYEDVQDRPPAGVFCTVGKGAAILWGTHPEHFAPLAVDDGNQMKTRNEEELTKDYKDRQNLFRAALALLGLETAAIQTSIPHLLPILVVSADQSRVASFKRAIETKAQDASIRDAHDVFHFSSQASLPSLFKEARSQIPTLDFDELKGRTKEFIFCESELPNQSEVPLFDLRRFFTLLKTYRSAVSSESVWEFGSLLFYGESLTSTQTLLDKNPTVLSLVPLHTVFLASHQISGRGRGTNPWVSSPGCLQFSFTLSLPATFAMRVIFIQYIMGLAVVEGLRSEGVYEDLQIRLKWPNDVYVEMDDGRGERWKKIGGILVNSTFINNVFQIVVGCGINTSNPRPTTSINELIEYQNRNLPRTTAPIPALTQEELLARVLIKFEMMYRSFISTQGDFRPFLDSYIQHWLHSDQLVTIEETDEKVIIKGITEDSGLLRTESVASRQIIDLQPDGNTFDMMRGLLKTKK
ncbi:class II aaRS and biotin synthetase [Atractiella rhizophila]|nr:class II aaRS and biotin synthetase [Atractiella rhizophila]